MECIIDTVTIDIIIRDIVIIDVIIVDKHIHGYKYIYIKKVETALKIDATLNLVEHRKSILLHNYYH